MKEQGCFVCPCVTGSELGQYPVEDVNLFHFAVWSLNITGPFGLTLQDLGIATDEVNDSIR